MVGTDDDDVLPGSVGDDVIEGLLGDDFLIGFVGDDTLLGGLGDDHIIGGTGDDVMDGGAGDDVLVADEGDDALIGGIGSDTFIVAGGTVGDTIFINDVDGLADTLHAREANTSALIDLSPGESSFVDGREIQTASPTSVSLPLDLVLVEDLSGSFGDDIETVGGLASDLTAAVSGVADDVNLGLASFVDKPVAPFGDSGDHEYRTDLALTADLGDWETAVQGLTTFSGGDGPESQLTALLQVALRTGEVGWRDGSVKVVVVATDASFHVAGDHSAPPNDGDDVTDGPGDDGTGEDYPTVAQARDALSALGVIPIFAVTEGVSDAYEGLVSDFGFGAVVDLSTDSADIVEVFEETIEEVSATFIERAIGGRLDDRIRGNSVANELNGGRGDDRIWGLSRADALSGGLGEDRLRGDEGADLLLGGRGDDRLFGGAGTDVFEFGENHGDDVIRDFEAGDDTIRYAGTGLAFGDLTITDNGTHATIVSAEGEIVVRDALVADLGAGVFEFV